MRICKALDVPPRMLAVHLGVEYADLEPMLNRPYSQLPSVDEDEVWWRLYELISERIAMLMVVRAELDRALQKSRTKKAQRFAAMVSRGKRTRPNGRG